jgi:hypothetical protein
MPVIGESGKKKSKKPVKPDPSFKSAVNESSESSTIPKLGDSAKTAIAPETQKKEKKLYKETQTPAGKKAAKEVGVYGSVKYKDGKPVSGKTAAGTSVSVGGAKKSGGGGSTVTRSGGGGGGGGGGSDSGRSTFTTAGWSNPGVGDAPTAPGPHIGSYNTPRIDDEFSKSVDLAGRPGGGFNDFPFAPAYFDGTGGAAGGEGGGQTGGATNPLAAGGAVDEATKGQTLEDIVHGAKRKGRVKRERASE